jgi:alkylated DNA nucleotide flippase Atl1
MSHHGGAVPWHRVVAANGRVVPGHEREALRRLRDEGTPLRGDGPDTKVDMRKAAWYPGSEH